VLPTGLVGGQGEARSKVRPWCGDAATACSASACSPSRGVGVSGDIGVDLRLGSFMLVVVDVIVAPGSGFSSALSS